jgi:hypothetical protein
VVEKCECNIGGLVLLGRGSGLGGDVDALIFQEYTEACGSGLMVIFSISRSC